jgi:hypothetical protein
MSKLKLNKSEQQIVDWLLKSADDWQTVEGPHISQKLDCSCCFACEEAITYRVIAQSIIENEHRKGDLPSVKAMVSRLRGRIYKIEEDLKYAKEKLKELL